MYTKLKSLKDGEPRERYSDFVRMAKAIELPELIRQATRVGLDFRTPKTQEELAYLRAHQEGVEHTLALIYNLLSEVDKLKKL